MISLRPSQMIGKMQLTSLHRNGEALTTKATIFLCNAPLQDIIFRFMERIGEDSWQWSEFPNKIAVQSDDTHPTLRIDAVTDER